MLSKKNCIKRWLRCLFLSVPILLVFSAQPALALAVWNPTTSTITLPSTLDIPANTAVGQIIWTSAGVTSNMQDRNNVNAYFCGILTGVGIASGNDTYATAISGVGLRVRSVLNTTLWGSRPYQINSTGDCLDKDTYWTGSSERFFPQTVYLELVRIPGTLGAGTLNLSNINVNLRFNCENSCTNSWSISVSGNTEVKVSSCTVNTYDKIVNLGTLYTQKLTSIGPTSNGANFVINLACTSTSLTPSITFAGSKDDVQSKVFANDSGSAKGVGVQLLYGNNVITPDLKLSLGPAQTTLSTDYNFKARLYQTAAAVTAGSVDTTIIFTIDYSNL